MNKMQNSADKQLIKSVLAGDEAAFRQFFSEYVHRIYRFALPRVGNDEEAAKDIAQQTMTKAIRNMSAYRGEAQLFTWLCAICRKESVDWLRRHNKHSENVVLIEDRPDVRSAIESLHADINDSPEYQQAREQRFRIIQVALDQLPEKYGNALEWKYIEGYSIIEIANRLDISNEATQSLLARAKRAFADVYITLQRGTSVTTPAGPLL